MDQNEFNRKIHEKFKDEFFQVVRYGKNSYEDSEIICNTCHRHIIVNTGELFRKRRKHLCSKCCYLREDSLKNRNIIIKKFKKQGINEFNFFFEGQKNKIRIQKVSWNCPICNRNNTNNVTELLDRIIRCGHCDTGEKKDTKDIQFQLDTLYPNHFCVISEYLGANKKIKVKCLKCGFIRDVSANSLLQHGFCPKCGKTKSKGEKKIIEWLNLNNIAFETQKYYKDWNIGLHYFDFFIPSINLLLEFHGKQHYENIDFFNPLKIQKEQDDKKKNAAISNGFNFCSIKYTCLPQIDSILSYLFNSTTIPRGSRGKLLEIETIQDLDEDIV